MMATLGLISDVGALSGRHLRHLRRAPGRLVVVMMNPLVMMFAVGYLFKNSIVVPGSSSYEEYLMAGVAVQVALSSIGPTAVGVATDFKGGLVDRFRSLPIVPITVLVGRTLADLVVAALGLVVVTGFGFALGWRTHADPLRVAAGFALLLAFVYVLVWVGVTLGTTMRTPETIDATGALILVAFSFLSNAFMSVSRMPSWIKPLAEWNPVSAVITSCRRLWGNPVSAGNSFPEQHSALVATVSLSVVLVVAVVLSVRAFRRAVNP